MTTTFQVDDMTCGHCAGTITKALQAADAAAKVTIDLARHLVSVDSATTGAQALGLVIREAGYTPVAVDAPAAAPAPAGGCCGHCG